MTYELDNTTYLNPRGIFYYITIYSERAGTYVMTIQGKMTTTLTVQARTIEIFVNPAPVNQITLVNFTQLT